MLNFEEVGFLSSAALGKLIKLDKTVKRHGGKLKLAKGSLFALLPYAKAAKELVASAIEVETTFPEGW